MQQFNPIDAALLFLETPSTPFHVSMTCIYDPSTCPGDAPTFEDIVEAVRVSLPGAPSFRRKIVRVPFDVDYPYWVEDEHFDLEYHMRHLALPKPGNWEQFRTQVSRIISRPLDLSRPPWEITVIEGLDNVKGLSKGCFALVLKVHHCAIDGQAGVALFTLLQQDSPNKKPAVLKDTWKPEPVPEEKELIKNAWINGVKKPAKIARLVWTNRSSLFKAVVHEEHEDEHADHEEDEHVVVPKTPWQGKVSPHRIFDDVRCTLEELKRVRSVVPGSTINDVCLTIVAEGMRRYLKAKNKLPKHSLLTAVPIATRTPEQAKAGGNQISLTRVMLRTDIEDPIERLEAITTETSAKKAMQNGVVMKTILDVVYNLPGTLVGLAAKAAPTLVLRSDEGVICNTMVTNVPGPLQPMYLLGAKNVYSTGCSPLMEGGGLLHAVSSFHGDFLFTFTACRELVKDSDFYRQCLEDAVKAVIGRADKELAKPRRALPDKKEPASKKAATTKSSATRKRTAIKKKSVTRKSAASKKQAATPAKSAAKKPVAKKSAASKTAAS